MNIPSELQTSELQTKDWRKTQNWWKGGKSNECEIYQRNQIQQITNQICKKTNKRCVNCEEYFNTIIPYLK